MLDYYEDFVNYILEMELDDECNFTELGKQLGMEETEFRNMEEACY